MRVENETRRAAAARPRDFEITRHAGQESTGRCRSRRPTSSPTAPADRVDTTATEPDPVGRPRATTPTQGELLLFKIPDASLDNRPLELKITGRSTDGKCTQADVDLDV